MIKQYNNEQLVNVTTIHPQAINNTAARKWNQSIPEME